MKHFLLISVGLDILPLLYAVSRQPQLWDQHPLRTSFPGSPHAEVSDILLRFQVPEVGASVQTINANHESVPYPAWWVLPEARPLVFGLMGRVSATRLGRVLLTRLRPGCRIPPHVDSAPHSVYYARHHITLCTPPECYFRVEDEVITMRPGECWLVANSKEHTVWNDGTTERIVLIVDTHGDATPETEQLQGQGGLS